MAFIKKIFFLFFLVLGFCLNVSFQEEAKTGLNIGERAPELKLPGIDGKLLLLSSLRGKMVLINFWASWSGPCRLDNSNLVLAYNKYHNAKFKSGNGFEIYNVSFDNQREKWLQAIEMDNLSGCIHASDLQWFNSQAAKIYKLKEAELPRNFLIDGDGIIVAKQLIGNNVNNGISVNISKLDAELAKHQKQ